MFSTTTLKLLLSALLLTFTLSISITTAQTIEGTVVDAESGSPLSGANVVQEESGNGTTSDEEGRFLLKLVEGASSQIRISYVGYTAKSIDTDDAEADADQPLEIQLKPRLYKSNAIFVQALRVDDTVPVASETLERAEIKNRNLGQDIPYLLSSMPSVTTTSDAGAGIGYSGIRIRGVDPGRINVTINGIPVNDAESHGVFWVNLPDLASSVEDIQVQRGVGTSTNGAAAFGGSINMQTSEMRPEAFGEISAGAGSFNTRRFSVQLGSGQLDNGWQVQGRLSKIDSDGYVDRAFSDLQSFYLSASHQGERGLLRADVFSGREQTYQSWYGISEQRLAEDRTYNPAGTEKPGEPYDNQTDNYQQDYYQLHYSYDLAENWQANASLHYTYGRGYYEEYKADQSFAEYGLQPVMMPDTTINNTDLVRQLWLDNHFYGTVFSTNYRQENWKLTIGGGYNEYRGDHYDEVVQAEFGRIPSGGDRYNQNNATKTDGNLYGKFNYSFSDELSGYLDLQVRNVTYEFLGKDLVPDPSGGQNAVDVTQDDRLTFFNPKLGLVYRFAGNHRAYASFGVANKEPTRDEYVNSTPETRPRHESLYDWEAGYEAEFDRFFGGVNLYYMDYKDQLIPTGELNDVGAVVRQNVPDSYRAGIELQAGIRIIPEIQWSANATFSRNKIDEYTQFLDNFDTGEQASEVYTDTDIAFSPSFIGNSIVNFTKKAFSAELTTKYVSRQYLDNTQTSNRSLDSYMVNDLRLSYDFGGFNLVKNVEATVQINNIFDETYESNGYTFGFVSGGETTYSNFYYPQAGRNFLARVSIGF
jgi:iron complex outermembrane receptor protein